MPYVDGRQVVASIRSMCRRQRPSSCSRAGAQLTKDEKPPLQVDRLLGKPPRIRELRAALSELTGRRATDRLG